MHASEKRGNQMLEKVFRYHNKKGYVYGDTTAILVGKNEKVKYPKPSDAYIRIDGRLGRTLAIEFQGCYHYVDKHAMYEGENYDEIMFLLSKHAYPVDGVHGDIRKWNRRYVDTPNCKYRDQMGLAETFDMQGREDIGDMIREYYRNVIEEEE